MSDKAYKNCRSMEREAREILAHRLTPRERILDGIQARWTSLPPTTVEDVREWAESARLLHNAVITYDWKMLMLFP